MERLCPSLLAEITISRERQLGESESKAHINNWDGKQRVDKEF